MKRKEQIQDAAADYRDGICCGFYDPVADARQDSFICGAEWADEHPKPGMVNKQEFLERAYDYSQAVLEHDLGYYGAIDFANTFCKSMEK